MRTFLGLVAVVAAVVVVELLARHRTGFRRVLASLGRWLLAPVLLACRGASRFIDIFVSPRGVHERVAAWQYALWLLVGALPLALFAACAGLGLTLSVDPGYLLMVAALVHAAVLGAAFLTVYEDFDVMDGVIAADDRRMRGKHATIRGPVMAWSFLFFVVYVGASAAWLADVRGVALFVERPQTGWPVVDYALVALWTLPTRLIVTFANWLTGEHTVVDYSAVPLAQAFAFVSGFIATVLIVGIAAALVQRRWQLRRIVWEIGEGRDNEYPSLVGRGRRAPGYVQRGIVNAAFVERDVERQRRLMEVCRDAVIHAFPETLCRSLRPLDEGMQRIAIDRATELFRQHADEWDEASVASLFAAAMGALERARLGGEATKRLLRLMLTVATLRRDDLALGEKGKRRLRAIVDDELNQQRAADDAALRGYLRELLSEAGAAPPAPHFEPAPAQPRRPRPMAANSNGMRRPSAEVIPLPIGRPSLVAERDQPENQAPTALS